MEIPVNQSVSEQSQNLRAKTHAVKWFKQWVPQDIVATGGKCLLLKWVTEDSLGELKEKSVERDVVEPEPEPTTEVLFLCSYEGCGKTFVDAGALRKHAHVHGERQYICHYEGCGKKFLDSSKLKRHFLIHTGERDFVCPHEGCGKAFSLDFNLRSHMKTHSQENYHLCPYPDCGKRYAHEYKLKNHINSHHEKGMEEATPKYNTPPLGKPPKLSKPSPGVYGAASSERPYACPYEGCRKAYIHEYKLNLHLRREHPAHFLDDRNLQVNAEGEAYEGSDQEGRDENRSRNGRLAKLSRPQKPKLRPAVQKDARRNTAPESSCSVKQWAVKDMYEDDSEETEENAEERWRYPDDNIEDDEETEYED